jgi:hypothetical protein
MILSPAPARIADATDTPAGLARVAAIDLDEVHALMGSPYGVDVRDRLYRLHYYRQCFVASEAVDWLAQRYALARPLAVRLGQRLAANHRIAHVVDEHDFEDDYLFFRLVPLQRRRADDPTGAPQPGHVGRPVDVAELARALRAPGGVTPHTVTRWLVRYPQCFTGAEIADWIVAHYAVSRAHANAIGEELLARNTIRHVFDEHGFVDGRELYRYV